MPLLNTSLRYPERTYWQELIRLADWQNPARCRIAANGIICKPEFFGTLARRKEPRPSGTFFALASANGAIGGKSMFVRKSTFEHLVKRCESQQQQIEKLNEMVGILAQSLGSELEFNVKKDWNLSRYPNNEQHMNALDWSF